MNATTVTMPLEAFDEMREERKTLYMANRTLSDKLAKAELAAQDKASMVRELFPPATWPVTIRTGLNQDHLVAIDEHGTITDHGRQILPAEA